MDLAGRVLKLPAANKTVCPMTRENTMKEISAFPCPKDLCFKDDTSKTRYSGKLLGEGITLNAFPTLNVLKSAIDYI